MSDFYISHLDVLKKSLPMSVLFLRPPCGSNFLLGKCARGSYPYSDNNTENSSEYPHRHCECYLNGCFNPSEFQLTSLVCLFHCTGYLLLFCILALTIHKVWLLGSIFLSISLGFWHLNILHHFYSKRTTQNILSILQAFLRWECINKTIHKTTCCVLQTESQLCKLFIQLRGI